MAPVVEGFFIDDARRLLPRIAEEAQRAEGDAFLRQEAPTPACTRRSTGCSCGGACRSSPLRIRCCDGSRSSTGPRAISGARSPWRASTSSARSATRSSRGRQLLDGVDPRIARLFRWHGYEEVEHKAVLFDAFHAARGHGLYTYAVRIAGLWIAVVLIALALPSVFVPYPRQRRRGARPCARGGASSALSSGAAGCCAVDGAPSPPTIGATSTRGGTSTTGASCRSSATRSSIPHGRSERAELSRGRRMRRKWAPGAQNRVLGRDACGACCLVV